MLKKKVVSQVKLESKCILGLKSFLKCNCTKLTKNQFLLIPGVLTVQLIICTLNLKCLEAIWWRWHISGPRAPGSRHIPCLGYVKPSVVAKWITVGALVKGLAPNKIEGGFQNRACQHQCPQMRSPKWLPPLSQSPGESQLPLGSLGGSPRSASGSDPGVF